MEYNKIKNKFKKTRSDLEKIRNYKECRRTNDAKQKYYEKHKEILAPFLKRIRGLKYSEAIKLSETLNQNDKRIFDNYLCCILKNRIVQQ